MNRNPYDTDSLGGWFDWIPGIGPDEPAPKVTNSSDKTPADPGMIEGFKIKARNWAKQVVDLFNTDVTGSPELEAEKMRLLKWAKYIKSGIESVFGTLDDLQNVNLGFLPLIPIAAILGAGALLAKWLTDYAEFKDKLKLHAQLVKSGSSPADASRVVDRLVGDKPLVNVGNPLLWTGLGGLGLWLFLRKKRG